MQHYAVFIPIGCCLGLTLIATMLFTVLCNVQIRAGKIAIAMRSLTVYVGFMSLIFLSLGGIAFYHGGHLEASSLGGQAQYLHSKFNGLTIQCGIMSALVVIGWSILYQPYEHYLLKTRKIAR